MKTRSIVLVAVLAAVATLSSHIASIPVLGARVFPVQHAINVTAAVLLGPGPAVLVAFLAAVLRNLLGTGTILAFPGGMIGALVAGFAYRLTRRRWCACIGEMIGTGIIGALLAYPMARFILGRSVAALTYVVPFAMSSTVGAVLGLALTIALQNTPVGLQAETQRASGGYRETRGPRH